MARRQQPKFQAGQPVRASHLNHLGKEIGRLNGLETSGETDYVDNATGRHAMPAKSSNLQICHGVILEVCNQGCGTYRVQRVHRYLRAPCDDCGSGSGS